MQATDNDEFHIDWGFKKFSVSVWAYDNKVCFTFCLNAVSAEAAEEYIRLTYPNCGDVFAGEDNT